jgi:hypothetical protein
LALPTLLNGCNTWAIREQDKSRVTSAKLKFMRTMEKYHGKIAKPTNIYYHNLKLIQL